jgi:hypothetical protein
LLETDWDSPELPGTSSYLVQKVIQFMWVYMPKGICGITALVLFIGICGCGPSTSDQTPENRSQATTDSDSASLPGGASASEKEAVLADRDAFDATVAEGPIELPAYEITADRLLSGVLPNELLNEGWVSLFDGHTLAGWSIVGQADWHSRDGVLRVSKGDKSFLCTNFEIADCELRVDVRWSPETNSGIFLRTTPEPGDVSLDCLEVNIAPPENPFPTGSLVGRQRVDPQQLPDFEPTDWHTFTIRLDGQSVTVQLDGTTILDAVDDSSSRRGHISLQHNEGVVEFRNILLRPIERQELKLDGDWNEDWVFQEKAPGTMQVEPTPEGLRIKGGLGKVQSRRALGDFWLQAQYALENPDVNSGIFFRCIEDSMIDGYECQINHSMLEADPLRPKDAGTGAIFRRRDARIVVGDGTETTHLSLLASGNQIMTWVNGLLTAEFYDDRPADENPRRGSRIDPGPIALQGHDAGTDITFSQMQVTELR